MYNINYYIIFFLLLYNFTLKAEFVIPIPDKKIYPVNDFAKILNDKEINLLNNKIIKFYKKNSIEILINIVRNLKGDDIAMVASNWGELWKIGNKKESNGILILLSIEDKKISIQTGYGIEPYLTDIKSKIIINNIIKPNIINGNYYLSIDKSIDAIFSILNKKFIKNNILKKQNYNKNFLIYILLSGLLLIIYLIRKIKNNNINIEYDPFLLNEYHVKDNNINNEDDFDGFGGGGNFGGGGASGSW